MHSALPHTNAGLLGLSFACAVILLCSASMHVRAVNKGHSQMCVPLSAAGKSANLLLPVQVFIPDEQLPELPQELCGIWSYIQWEHEGCPSRSHQASDAAYQHAIQARLLLLILCETLACC